MGRPGVQYFLFISDKEWVNTTKRSTVCAPHMLLTGHKDTLPQRECYGKALGSWAPLHFLTCCRDLQKQGYNNSHSIIFPTLSLIEKAWPGIRHERTDGFYLLISTHLQSLNKEINSDSIFCTKPTEFPCQDCHELSSFRKPIRFSLI